MNFVIGGVGEHIADYWEHKPSQVYQGKLNDNHKLTKNSYIGNDRGIDGFWRADSNNLINQGKKYAIVEAKSTTGVALATTEYVASRLGKLKKKHNGKPIIQMDHVWIKGSIRKLLPKLPPSVQKDFLGMGNTGDFSRLYSRHIIIVSLLYDPGLSHIEALLDDTKSDLDHANHNGIVIHKHGEPTIENIIKKKHQRLKNQDSQSKNK